MLSHPIAVACKMITRATLFALFVCTGLAHADTATKDFNIAAQPAAAALNEFARQADITLVFSYELVSGSSTNPLKGKYSIGEALNQLLQGTKLTYSQISDSTVAISDKAGSKSTAAVVGPDIRLAQSLSSSSSTSSASDETDSKNPQNPENNSETSSSELGEMEVKGIPEILVKGKYSQNLDIVRTEDSPQPYVVFTAEEIEKSQSSSVEDFFRKRLPMMMNGAVQPNNQVAGSASNVSAINLRGLGVQQTLILIDGRRVARVVNNAIDFTQTDINGISLASIERIEILPSTAGAIYGGGAVGGVINIIRKRNYNGLNIQTSYDGPFRGGGETLRFDATGGFSLEGGRTQISVSASHADSRPLYLSDIDTHLWRPGRQLILDNDANSFLAGTIAGFTPNIRSQSGANLVLDAALGGTSLNSNHASIPIGYRGLALDGAGPLVANAGRYNIDMSNDVRGRYAVLRNNPLVRSADLNIRRAFTDWMDVFTDFSINENRGRSRAGVNTGQTTLAATAPNNPFQQAISVTYPLSVNNQPAVKNDRILAATGGLIARMGNSWAATAEYNWSRSRSNSSSTNVPLSAAGATAIANGTLDVMRDLDAFPLDLSPYSLTGPDTDSEFEMRLQLLSARVSGSLFELPGGSLSLTALAEHRLEKAPQLRSKSSFIIGNSVFTSDFIFPERSQAVDSGYLELRTPLVSDRNVMLFAQAIELQASVRYDSYKTLFPNPSRYSAVGPSPALIGEVESRLHSTDYMIALRWAPIRDLNLRGSYGTGFLPPSLPQVAALNETPSGIAAGLLDPLRGNQPLGSTGSWINAAGGNPNLLPELSKSLSVGAVVTPRWLPALRLSVDYTRITKSDEIVSVSQTTMLANEALFPERVVRGPRLQTDPASWAGPVTRLDISPINAAGSRVKAWDFQVDYSLDTNGMGDFRFYAIATRETQFWRQLLSSSIPFDLVDFRNGPLEWRGNVGVDWTIDGWELGWNAQYYHDYNVRFGIDPTSASEIAQNNLAILQQGADRIPSQIYHDLNIRYHFGTAMPSLLADMDLSIGIQNIFDSKPPVLANPDVGYSPYGDPRLRRYVLTIFKRFGGSK